jgi:adenylate cyclase
VSPSAETLSKWFAALELLQHNSAGTTNFFQQAAIATTNPGGMTAGFVILRVHDEWTVVGSHVPDPTLGISYCCDVLARVLQDGRTHYHDASEDAENLPAGADSVVASPIFDDTDQVMGVVYGYRSMRSRNQRRSIRALEAVWIQLLAGSVSAALSRMHSEAQAARKSVLLEQVFSPKVIHEITRNPNVLSGQERETTVLFADLRDSSKISQTLSPQDNYTFLHELLEALSVQVRTHDGVIIDYYGDGMAAMWNAPSDQPDHPLLACRAAFHMQQDVTELNNRWQDRLGRPIRLGIGINTGTTRVGNAGSQTRLKYGPRGTSVIVASRLESATKHLGPAILMTAATAERLGSQAKLRRVCRARLAGIYEPMDIYELCALDANQLSDDLLQRIGQYQMALGLFEQGDLKQAEEILLEYTQSAAGQQFSADFILDVIRSSRKNPDQVAQSGVVDLA